MVNFKKIDDQDLVFINKPVSKKDDEAFSLFLKKRRKKSGLPAQKAQKPKKKKNPA